MSAAPLRTRSHAAIDIVFLVALAACGALTAWPIYRDPWMFVTMGGAMILAVTVAAIAARFRWRWWWVLATVTLAYIIVGVPLVSPGLPANPQEFLTTWVQVLTAPVTGWKNILTLDLPLGTYQATLAPALLVFLVVPVVSLSAAWRTGARWVWAVPIALLLPLFGVLFGSSAVRGIFTLGPVPLTGAVELLAGLASLLIALGWYVTRAFVARSRALRVARTASNVRVRRRAGATASKWGLGAILVVLAVAFGAVFAPLALTGHTRDVPRTAIDPEVEIRQALSPLTNYREYFSDELYDTTLFSIETSANVTRVRLATLSYFDGVAARVIDPLADVADDSTAFVRVPASVAAEASELTATVTIESYDDVWVPTIGSLTSIGFIGAGATALTDGFYYNTTAAMGIELAEPGFTAGARYTQSATSLANERDAELQPTHTEPRIAEVFVPVALTGWIEAQQVTSDAAGLLELIDRLRARGYLSHSLSIDAATAPAWTQDLENYSFSPSRAGHSTDRLNTLFTELLDRQNDVGGNDDAALVAAVGDDEQFAVAAALIADQLGFAARVVVGARLSVDPNDPLPACVDGVCVSQDISAWIEVQSTSGLWIPIDTTPQYANPLASTFDQRSDPQNPTEVYPEDAEAVPPPDAAPAEGSAEDGVSPNERDFTALWQALRIGGIAALILVLLATPLLAILLAKTLRRRARRAAPTSADRVSAGWDEYVDCAIDHGYPRPSAHTRLELAQIYSGSLTGRALLLAAGADRSSFDHAEPRTEHSEAYWRLVDAERVALSASLSRWQRLRARLSVRSLLNTGSRLRTVPAISEPVTDPVTESVDKPAQEESASR